MPGTGCQIIWILSLVPDLQGCATLDRSLNPLGLLVQL